MSSEAQKIQNADLVDGLRQGDPAAYRELMRLYERRLFGFAFSMLRDHDASMDVVQDTFVRVFRKVHTFKGEAAFSTWLFPIARNLCIDHLRKMSLRRHPSLDQASGKDADGPTLGERIADEHPSTAADRSAVSADIAQRIVKAVEALPPEQREVFLLRQTAKVPFKEIAKMTGVPENTVKSRMRYALERLQDALCEYEDYARALR